MIPYVSLEVQLKHIMCINIIRHKRSKYQCQRKIKRIPLETILFKASGKESIAFNGTIGRNYCKQYQESKLNPIMTAITTADKRTLTAQQCLLPARDVK